MSHTFVIIDGSSLVHRAFYALPFLTTANGQHTNAVYGFTTMLVKLLNDIKPEAVAVAFDKGKITFRNEAYSEYKAHRKPTPHELSEQFPLVHELLRAFGVRMLEEAGYEADDIIGTLAAMASREGYQVIIVTGDRDALQLISPTVRVMLTKKGISEMETIDVDALQQKYGVTPEQVIDLKGLTGDKSDNIPGVPGIGEKTAGKLIAEFGSIENLLINLDKVQGQKLQEKLRDNADIAKMSKKLATIVCDMDLDFSPESFTVKSNPDKLRELFSALEFKSLLNKVKDITASDSEISYDSTKGEPPQAHIAARYDEVASVISQVRAASLLEFFPVITGKVPDIKIQGLAIDTGGKAVFIPAGIDGWQEILTILADDKIKKVTHDAKLLYNACNALAIPLRGLIFDTLLAAYLLNPTAADYPITSLVEKYLGQKIGWQEQKFGDTPDFAAWAASAIHNLYPALKSCLAESGLDELYYDIELPLVEVLSAMEINGIKVDSAYMQDMTVEIANKIELLLKEIYELAEEEFNVNSTKQLGVILFEKLKLPIIKKTKTGYSTDAEVLEKLAGQHPLIDKLLEYRMLTKLKSTYLDGLQGLIDSETGRIHTTFNQMVTATGRLSSSEPNLQNIPIRSEIGRKIRELFVPGDGYDYIMAADYSQIELRILAHISEDLNLIESFRQNQDVHTRTAAEVFGTTMDEVTSQMRARAKAVNFGIVYGISDYGLSRDIGVSRKEAAQYIESYFAKYRGVKAYIDRVIGEAHRQGYVTTMFGRRRYLPDINSSNFNQRSFAERTAMNTPIQGTAADIIKKAMINVYNALQAKALKSRVLLQVHDELVLEVISQEASVVAGIVKDAMEKAANLAVPLTVDVKTGRNWAEAK